MSEPCAACPFAGCDCKWAVRDALRAVRGNGNDSSDEEGL